MGRETQGERQRETGRNREKQREKDTKRETEETKTERKKMSKASEPPAKCSQVMETNKGILQTTLRSISVSFEAAGLGGLLSRGRDH